MQLSKNIRPSNLGRTKVFDIRITTSPSIRICNPIFSRLTLRLSGGLCVGPLEPGQTRVESHQRQEQRYLHHHLPPCQKRLQKRRSIAAARGRFAASLSDIQ